MEDPIFEKSINELRLWIRRSFSVTVPRRFLQDVAMVFNEFRSRFTARTRDTTLPFRSFFVTPRWGLLGLVRTIVELAS
jgi:hypothetical protein